MDINLLISKIKNREPKKIIVAEAQDDIVLKAVSKAHDIGIAVPILCGDSEKIKKIAGEINVDISKFEIIEAKTSKDSVKTAISLIRDGKADVLMKGLLQTADLLKGVLDKEAGLRGEGVLSHVGIMNSEKLGRTIFLTDSAMVMYPDTKTKVRLIENAVKVARGLDIEKPKVAVLAAVEVINLDMQATIDGAILSMMNKRGQIKDCIVDGPLALDLAISKEAVEHKGIKSEVAGEADILLFHNIEASNSAYKIMTNMSEGVMGGVIMGAKVPIVLTSRSDSDESKLYSIACAVKIQ